MKTKILTPKNIDLVIWILLLIVFIYDGFVGKASDITWGIAIALLLTSLVIKLIYVGDKNEK